MSPHPAFMMASQPSPALPHTLPFISSPDSTNTTPNSAPPAPTSNSTPNPARPSGAYYPNGSSHQTQQQHQSHQQHQQHSQNGVPHSDASNDHLSDPEGLPQDARPLLETEGVISSEVGAVPGILHQDLHPDGQPRRPMNAFMIFARHRRPAIQAKEPGLKTGEISKRLSHDWKNLPDDDKSHYLEQAKLLKDEFHNRFPEYVYKRRPNNTGKRRSSASQQQLQPKFSCGPGTPQMMTGPGANSMSGLPHPGDIHHHPQHHPGHSEMYPPPPTAHHPHSMIHHPASHHHHAAGAQLPRLPPTMTHPSKANGFYPTPNPSSPRYHQIGQPQQIHGPSQSARTPGPQYTTGNGPPTSSGPSTHSPRPPSPSSAHTSNGMPPYLRLSQPLSQQPPSQYSWFANEQQYGGGHHQQPHSVSTPVSGGRPSFYYPSWPPATGEPNLQSDHPGQDHAVNHNRAASYSGGSGLFRPTSPSAAERARQLSLPSHTLAPPDSYIKSETGYAGAALKAENTNTSAYASTPSAQAKAEPQPSLGPAPPSAYSTYHNGSNAPPADSRSYSTSSTSPIGSSFNGPRGMFTAPMSDASTGTYDPHQSPMIPDSQAHRAVPQPQASSVAY